MYEKYVGTFYFALHVHLRIYYFDLNHLSVRDTAIYIYKSQTEVRLTYFDS